MLPWRARSPSPPHVLPFPPPPERFLRALRGATGRGVRVAVIDTGWDRAHPDPRVLPGAGVVDPEHDFTLVPSDDDGDRLGHGTAVASLVLRVAPEAEIVPVRVFGGRLETTPGALAAGIGWAARRGIPLANLSVGTTLASARAPLREACAEARRAGTLLVAAAHTPTAYPAVLDEVIGVGAGHLAAPWDFRHHPGPVECTAAGHDLPVRWLRGETEVMSGASFAAPLVTGIVARVLERHPGAGLPEVRRILAGLALAR